MQWPSRAEVQAHEQRLRETAGQSPLEYVGCIAVCFIVILGFCFFVEHCAPGLLHSGRPSPLAECTAMEIGDDTNPHTGKVDRWKDYYCPGDSTVRYWGNGVIERRP